MNLAKNLSRDFPQVVGENFTNEAKERWATDFKILLRWRDVTLAVSLTPTEYLRRGRENIQSGQMLKGGGRHSDAQYWVRKVGDDDYSLTIANRRGAMLSIDTWRSGGDATTRETVERGLARSGVTPPRGFWEGL